MMIFQPDSDGLNAVEIADNALDCLSDKIRVTRKSELIKNIKQQMRILVKNELKDYLMETSDDKFKPKNNTQINHATKEKIAKILKWAGLSPIKETK